MSPERDLPPHESDSVDELEDLLSARAKLSPMRVDLTEHSLDVFRERVRARGKGSDFEAFISYFGTLPAIRPVTISAEYVIELPNTSTKNSLSQTRRH